MAAKTLFELVSPERLLISREVEMVVVPGAEGDFGVLAEHAPMISTVRPGVIEVYDTYNGGEQPSERIFVAGGFAEVTGERCTVLAETATPISELDRGAIEKALAEARTRHAAAADDVVRAEIDREIEVLDAKTAALV